MKPFTNANVRSTWVKISAENPRCVLIVGGQRGPAFRYRCEHLAEEFGFLGWRPDIVNLSDAVGYPKSLSKYDVIVLHRILYSPDMGMVLEQSATCHRRVLFDVDDLVFDDRFAGQIPDARKSAQFRKHVIQVTRLHAESIRHCTGALVSTQSLRERMKDLFPALPVWVKRNAVSDFMVAQAQSTARVFNQSDTTIRLGYFSGTQTHKWDFAKCERPILHIMERHPDVKLILAGAIDVPELLLPVLDRIEVFPLVPWRDLPVVMAPAAINLAPLEVNSHFTECKSELKYLEAGLLGIPTVASNVGGFRRVIQSGMNGFLCSSQQDWEWALDELISRADLREYIGARARTDVLMNHTTRARSNELGKIILEAI